MKRGGDIFFLLLGVFLYACGGTVSYNAPSLQIDPELPSEISIFDESFDAGHLHFWNFVRDERVEIEGTAGMDSTDGLKVTVGIEQAFIYTDDTARMEQGYLKFWFNPNSVLIRDDVLIARQDRSIEIAGLRKDYTDGTDKTSIALMLRQNSQGVYKGYLKWNTSQGEQFASEDTEFEIKNQWQEIKLGFSLDSWISVWIDGVEVSRIKDMDHLYDSAYGIFIGQLNNLESLDPEGSLLFDSISLLLPYRSDIWVDGSSGDDSNSGFSELEAFKTIQKGLNHVSPGTTVHIQPGIYRESLDIAVGGIRDWPVTIRAEKGAGTVMVRGSIPSSDLSWAPLINNDIGLPSNADLNSVYVADLSDYNVTIKPRFIVMTDGSTEDAWRLPLAREPDWEVKTEWKHHEYFWAADGGDMFETCTPNPSDRNCDCPDPALPYNCPSRSFYWLTDRTDDTEPFDIEPGNLTTLGDLTGATLRVMDLKQGHFLFKRTIVEHLINEGSVKVDNHCSFQGRELLGWGSKYYVENLPSLLDQPGEWWFDETTKKLYLWSPAPENPSQLSLEVSVENTGIDLENRSYVILDGLNFEFYGSNIIQIRNKDRERSVAVELKNSRMRYAKHGLYFHQKATISEEFKIDGFLLENSLIEYMDNNAVNMFYSWDENDDIEAFIYPGITNTTIRDNEMHHLGFYSDNSFPVGLQIAFADKFNFIRNHIHHVAHCGMNFWSAVDSPHKNRDFLPEEIKTGNILVKDNIFEKACQQNADCGALKISGNPRTADTKHVFRDFLITGNIFRDTYGWTYSTEKRGGRWSGEGSDIRGMGGFGLYVDYASGIHAYRNIAYNNAYINYHMYGYWRDGEMIYYNNIAANSVHGFQMSSNIHAEVESVNTQIVNNIIINNEAHGIMLFDQDDYYENILFDNNLYFNNAWRSYEDGGVQYSGALCRRVEWPAECFQTIEEIQSGTGWENYGLEDDPLFVNYDLNDLSYFDGSWPDFRISEESSVAVDSGTEIPDSLSRLLSINGIENPKEGDAWDLGYHEYGTEKEVVGGMSSGGCAAVSGNKQESQFFFMFILLVFILILRKKQIFYNEG